MYSSYSVLTSALHGGEWLASSLGRTLPPGKGPPVPTGQEAGWASEPVWTQRLEQGWANYGPLRGSMRPAEGLENAKKKEVWKNIYATIIKPSKMKAE
jgi:hypothetical protein